MDYSISFNLIDLGKFLKRHKLKSKGKLEVIKAAQKRYSTWSSLNRLSRKIVFKESNINNMYL